MKIQISDKNETRILEDPTLNTLLELNKTYQIEPPGVSFYFSKPFDTLVTQKGSEGLATIFPLLDSCFYGSSVTMINVGQLEQDSKLLSAISLCYALPHEQLVEIRKYFRGASGSSILSEYNFFYLYSHSQNCTKAVIFSYLVGSKRATLALEYKSLFENKDFSIDFMLDLLEKKEEFDDLLSTR